MKSAKLLRKKNQAVVEREGSFSDKEIEVIFSSDNYRKMGLEI